MSIVAFSCARFTPGDVALFHRIADPRLADGRWAALSRESTRDHDRLEVYLPGGETPLFRFERNARGQYALSMHDRGGWHVIGDGDDAAGCLAIWMTPGLG